MARRISITWFVLLATFFLAIPSYTHCLSLETQVEIPTVTYCALVNNPELYHQKTVRIRAIYIYQRYVNGVYISGGGPYLHDSGCVEGKPPFIRLKPGEYRNQTVISSHRSLESNSAPETVRAYRDILEKDQQVDITAVGIFYGPREQGYGHRGGSKFYFEMTKLEDAKPVRNERDDHR
jgi:hypothetical protein